MEIIPLRALKELQHWFGQMISQPLQPNHQFPPFTPSGKSIVVEAQLHIAPSRSLESHQRLEIYHQQYWLRLLKALQQNFPTVTRLFGVEIFNHLLAIPYLSENPPTDWALCRLGHTFPEWLKQRYKEKDHYLVITAATIDKAAGVASWIGGFPTVNFGQFSAEERRHTKLFLQPHIHLFSLHGDLFTFREKLLEQRPEHYDSHPFPQISVGKKYFSLYRTPHNMVAWKEITQAAYEMLLCFKKGSSIEQACTDIENRDEEILEEALREIPFWFKQWTVLQWFGQ